jgi:hypothetical protein
MQDYKQKGTAKHGPAAHAFIAGGTVAQCEHLKRKEGSAARLGRLRECLKEGVHCMHVYITKSIPADWALHHTSWDSIFNKSPQANCHQPCPILAFSLVLLVSMPLTRDLEQHGHTIVPVALLHTSS